LSGDGPDLVESGRGVVVQLLADQGLCQHCRAIFDSGKTAPFQMRGSDISLDNGLKNAIFTSEKVWRISVWPT